MLTRHFVKGLVTFTLMIVFGLIGVFLVNYFVENGVLYTENVTPVAE